MTASPMLKALEALRRCPGVDTTDQVTGETFDDMLVAALDTDLRPQLRKDLAENTAKAWDALARYKFWMFGYHAAHVVKLRRLLGLRGNPFKPLVDLARTEQGTVRV